MFKMSRLFLILPCKQAIKIIVILIYLHFQDDYFVVKEQQGQKVTIAFSILFNCITWQFSQKLIIFLVVISVAGPPATYDGWDPEPTFWGAAAVTSESGQGAILQHKEYFYELTCEISGCSWKILPQRLSPGVNQAVMMTLPPNYHC